MEYSSLRQKTFEIFKTIKVLEKKIDLGKRQVKFLKKLVMKEKIARKNFMKFVSLENFPPLPKKTFVVGNEIELSELAVAPQGEEVKAEEEEFAKARDIDSPEALKREELLKKKKNPLKRDPSSDGDKFQSPKRKIPSKRKQNTVVVIKLPQD